MNLVKVKHCMDDEFRIMTLDEAFLEALSLSNGCASEVGEFENDLLKSINSFIEKGHEDEILSIIKDEYKMSVLKGWEYEVEEYIVSNLVSVDVGKYNTKCIDLGRLNIAFEEL